MSRWSPWLPTAANPCSLEGCLGACRVVFSGGQRFHRRLPGKKAGSRWFPPGETLASARGQRVAARAKRPWSFDQHGNVPASKTPRILVDQTRLGAYRGKTAGFPGWSVPSGGRWPTVPWVAGQVFFRIPPLGRRRAPRWIQGSLILADTSFDGHPGDSTGLPPLLEDVDRAPSPVEGNPDGLHPRRSLHPPRGYGSPLRPGG